MTKFYFALPRLIASWSDKTAARSETNGLEANIIGTLNHLVVYVAAFELLLRDLPVWQELILLVPLAILVFFFWIIFFYLSAWLIKFLRRAGAMRELPANRAQNVMVAIMTTGFATYLIRAGTWSSMLGFIWIAAVALNLLAATVLPASHADRSANK